MNIYIVSTMSDSGKTAIVSALLRILSIKAFAHHHLRRRTCRLIATHPLRVAR